MSIIHIKSFRNFVSSVFILIPFALVTGPFLADLFLCIVALYGLCSIFSSDLREKYLFNIYIIILTLFYLSSLISSIYSDDIIFSLESSLFFFRYPLFIFGGVCLLHFNANLIKYFSYSVTLVILVIFFDLIFEIIFGFNTLGNVSPYKNIGRYSSFFSEELIMGKFTSLLLPYIFLFNFYKNNKIQHQNILLVLFIPIAFIIIFFSGERTALIYFIIFLIIFITSNFITTKVKLFTFFLILIIFFSTLVVPNKFKDRLIDSTINQIILKNNDSEKFELKFFSEIHELHYKTALNMFYQNKIFGIGPKMFRKLCDDEKYVVKLKYDRLKDYENITNGCSTHPHNYYLQIISENGTFGFLIILSLISIILAKLTKLEKYTFLSMNRYILFIILINLFPFVPTNSFFNNWISVIIYLPFVFLIFSERKKIN